ncbi:MAG: antibiotic biosynthesis monooxygenase [Clostridiales bacterium]|nr:antibiotic biosynthesis monooxygenase [Clostridiales bacterium]
MVKVVAKNFVKADSIDAFLTIAKKLVEQTNEKDAGCIRYELFQDTENPQILTVIEEWESGEALQNHMSAKHFTELIPQLAALSEKPGEINIYNKLF